VPRYYFNKPIPLHKKNKSSAVAEMGDRGHNRHGPNRAGAAVPLSRGAGTPSNTMCLGRGLLPYQVASSSIQPFGHNRHGPKIGWGGCEYKVVWDEAYLHTKWHLSPSSRLDRIDVGRKLGAPPLFGEGSGSPSNT